MLIPLEHQPTPATGYERRDIGRWQAEAQVSFTHLTLYAPGWSLHHLHVGGKIVMLPWEGGARVSPAAPLTFKVNGFPAERIEIDLTAPPDVQSPAAPYIIVRAVPYKPFAPIGGARKKSRPRVIVVR